MLGDLWNEILQITSQFVIPDWGALIALLPIFIALLILAVLGWIFLKLWRAAPARRGKTRITPRTPSDIHMPGPSLAPILAAGGAFALFVGLVFGGDALLVGAIVLGVTLLYWLGEALRLYDRDIGPTTSSLPAVIHDGPPDGVHMPGPSFRPFLGAVGVAMLMLGLVFGEWLLAAGLIALVATLVGWLVDARKEYVKTVEADRTGHLENIPAPRTPTLMLSGLLVLLIGAVVIQAGWLPPGGANGGTGGSGEPGASSEPGGTAAPSAAPEATIVLTAKDIAFDTDSISGPKDLPFTLALDNQDDGVPHNVEFQDGTGASVWKGEIFNGIDTRVYDVGPLPGGTYTFLCTVHPSMTGTATLQ
jgi:hypothetical protein